MKKNTYLWTITLGKLIMILVVSFIGSDIRALITQPIRTAIVVMVLSQFYGLLEKELKKELDKKVDADFRSISKERKLKEEKI